MSLLDALIEDELWMPPPLGGVSPHVAVREIWICGRTDGGSQNSFGSGTRDDPYDGSSHAKFDTIISTLPINAVIRLGVGIFETKGGGGNSHVAVGFQPKQGWRIVGSGMFQT